MLSIFSEKRDANGIIVRLCLAPTATWFVGKTSGIFSWQTCCGGQGGQATTSTRYQVDPVFTQRVLSLNPGLQDKKSINMRSTVIRWSSWGSADYAGLSPLTRSCLESNSAWGWVQGVALWIMIMYIWGVCPQEFRNSQSIHRRKTSEIT